MKNLLANIPATMTLIVLNIAVFALTSFVPATTYLLAMYVPYIWQGMIWTPITAMFVHSDIMHISMNMLSLWFLGSVIEPLLGRKRFIALYMLSGLFGSLFSIAFELAFPDNSLFLGASGAIFGLFAAYGVVLVTVYRREKDSGENLERIQALKSGLTGYVVLLVANVAFSLTPGIGWQAHLGGFIAGIVITIAMLRRR